MDGTLLDLHYDNFFWLEYLPAQYARKHNTSLQQAKKLIEPQLVAKQGCLEWYCTDYWSNEFNMNISEIKAHDEVASKIAFREHAETFLKALKATGKKIWMLTNAHPDVLQIKMDRLPLKPYFDELISSHQLGYAKEDARFWQSLENGFSFNKGQVYLLMIVCPFCGVHRNMGLNTFVLYKIQIQKNLSKIQKSLWLLSCVRKLTV